MPVNVLRDNIDLLPRLWALQLAAMLDVELSGTLPQQWLAMARERAGRDFPPELLGDEPVEVDEASSAHADAQAFGEDQGGTGPLPTEPNGAAVGDRADGGRGACVRAVR